MTEMATLINIYNQGQMTSKTIIKHDSPSPAPQLTSAAPRRSGPALTQNYSLKKNKQLNVQSNHNWHSQTSAGSDRPPPIFTWAGRRLDRE
jgi:hypothetical protein